MHLEKLKTRTNILKTVAAVLITALSSIYLDFAVRYFIDMMEKGYDKIKRDYK